MTYLTLEEDDKPKPKFTPGPWHVSRGSRCHHVASADGTFETACIMFAGGEGTGEGNARLIAAAPALYGALQYVSEVSERQAAKDADDSDTANITVTIGWLREVKEALALVDGPQKETK